ncbi:imidazoleglycerol-phosphate dehydratase [Candidatus Omnitrophota bacterium]
MADTMNERKAEINRKTKETEISLSLQLDGKGESQINTGIGLLDHMLELFTFHGLFDLTINAQGDIKKVDIHHTNEDIGIVLGKAFKEALGEKASIRRFGSASVPMEDVVARVTADISGRGHFKMQSEITTQPSETEEGYSFSDVEHFLDSLAKNLGMNLVVNVDNLVEDVHTNLEPIFKALGIAMDQATQIDPRRDGIPSTKGVID